jgi:hypothetical protein
MLRIGIFLLGFKINLRLRNQPDRPGDEHHESRGVAREPPSQQARKEKDQLTMKISAKFNGKIDYRMQDYVYEMRRSLRRLVYKRRVCAPAAGTRSAVL